MSTKEQINTSVLEELEFQQTCTIIMSDLKTGKEIRGECGKPALFWTKIHRLTDCTDKFGFACMKCLNLQWSVNCNCEYVTSNGSRLLDYGPL